MLLLFVLVCVYHRLMKPNKLTFNGCLLQVLVAPHSLLYIAMSFVGTRCKRDTHAFQITTIFLILLVYTNTLLAAYVIEFLCYDRPYT